MVLVARKTSRKCLCQPSDPEYSMLEFPLLAFINKSDDDSILCIFSPKIIRMVQRIVHSMDRAIYLHQVGNATATMGNRRCTEVSSLILIVAKMNYNKRISVDLKKEGSKLISKNLCL